MSTPELGNGRGGVKTLAIRLEPDLHAQLSLIAQLRSSTITDEIRLAIETHITSVKSSPDLAGKADSVLEAIEREAATRREAIATLFSTRPAPIEPAEPTTSRTPRGRASKAEGTGTSGTD